MIGNILIILFFLLAPAGVLWLCNRVQWLGKVGPVLVLYIIGIFIGNILHPSGMAQIQDILSSAMVPMAIPLMLFGCRFSRSSTRSQLLALLTGIVAVTGAVTIGFFLFGKDIPDGAKIGGMLTGVYTGGTMNLAALKAMLGVDEETFILLNSYDMVISFLYLTFLLSIGIRLFRNILPNALGAARGAAVGLADGTAAGANDGAVVRLADGTAAGANDGLPEATDGSLLDGAVDSIPDAGGITRECSNPYSGIFRKEGLKEIGMLLLVDAAIIGISAGLGLLAGDGWFMTVLVLMLTTLGIAASFNVKIRSMKRSYDIGMYFIYVFSIVVASMADLSKFEIGSSLGLLGYLTFVIFGSLLLQVIFAKIFRIDSDTMTISSVTYICSPPFVPMIAAAMKNRNVIASGLAIGVVGYAAGNYLGFLMAQLLGRF